MGFPQLRGVQPLTTPTWPVSNDAGDLIGIVEAQSETIAEQAALIDRYQGVLKAAQAATGGSPATAVGTGTGTSLVTTGTNGVIKAGSVVAGTGVPAGTTIMSQTSGTTGGNGTYVTSQATTANNATLSFTPQAWPVAQDAPTLTLLVQNQTAMIRTQTTLIQNYLDVLNTSQTPAA
jgi:hypothetical protein